MGSVVFNDARIVGAASLMAKVLFLIAPYPVLPKCELFPGRYMSQSVSSVLFAPVALYNDPLGIDLKAVEASNMRHLPRIPGRVGEVFYHSDFETVCFSLAVK